MQEVIVIFHLWSIYEIYLDDLNTKVFNVKWSSILKTKRMNIAQQNFTSHSLEENGMTPPSLFYVLEWCTNEHGWIFLNNIENFFVSSVHL